jgi:peptide/nickel transport system ATP-binding protein
MAGNGTAHLRPHEQALLRVEDLTVEFPAGRRGTVHAVSGVSLDVLPGETLSLVGESGCGKSSTGRAIIQLPRPVRGSVVFEGDDLMSVNTSTLRRIRPKLQLIFQDPISSLNPRRTIGDIVEEPLRVWRHGTAAERGKKVDELLEAVGLDPKSKSRRPHEFSGGQCQRISIARALVLEPKMLICDEPVSALDVSVQAQILNLLEDMKARFQLTMLFISHDLAVVKNVSDRVLVMYLGKTCEVAAPDSLYAAPAHPYTNALLAAVPLPQPGTASDHEPLSGELPSPLTPPTGCRFRTRCALAQGICATEVPQMRPLVSDPQRHVACHFPLLEARAS